MKRDLKALLGNMDPTLPTFDPAVAREFGLKSALVRQAFQDGYTTVTQATARLKGVVSRSTIERVLAQLQPLG